ncbi:MAG TPA: secondary thiamine-phosphate synthase enzyme YjbQ [SAR202 cluster bacterium]|jgi:secondary thiamine-phosphate synthase enzyme|nr:secondary thiamine-phosphate synthase enzyme YjbQ [SAR202 cluster bacterium]|tara:strand:+ start:767 stop:1249 length:483 start_codon:yes stop_codon:yes gene_type:complete
MSVSHATMKTLTYYLRVPSSSSPEFIDITDEVNGFLKDSGISSGMLLVFSRHTTSAIVIQENEPLLLEDFKTLLENTASKDASYRHNDFDVRTVHMHENECPNGHSHCQHLVLGSSEMVPVIDGDMPLGEWQRIFMVELDGMKGEMVGSREIVVQIMGLG